MTDKKENEKVSFWQTIPGCITAIAGLITAIGGLIAVLYATHILPPSSATATPPFVASASPYFTSVPPNESPAPSTPSPTDIPPTFTPLIPTATPMPPSPVGRWKITANNYPGELNIITINNGKISGTIYDNLIEGTWNEFTQNITFKRINSSDPNVYQIYYGEQIKQGNKYILTGHFEDHDVNGVVNTYNWTAER